MSLIPSPLDHQATTEWYLQAPHWQTEVNRVGAARLADMDLISSAYRAVYLIDLRRYPYRSYHALNQAINAARTALADLDALHQELIASAGDPCSHLKETAS